MQSTAPEIPNSAFEKSGPKIGGVKPAVSKKMKNQTTVMNEDLQQLEALCIHPALQVSSGQRPAIVGTPGSGLTFQHSLSDDADT